MLLMACKIGKTVFTSFGGDAMASLMDISTPAQMAQMGAKLMSYAGVAIVLGPYARWSSSSGSAPTSGTSSSVHCSACSSACWSSSATGDAGEGQAPLAL